MMHAAEPRRPDSAGEGDELTAGPPAVRAGGLDEQVAGHRTHRVGRIGGDRGADRVMARPGSAAACRPGDHAGSCPGRSRPNRPAQVAVTAGP